MLLFIPAVSSAICKGKMINPIKDVCWDCVFPAKIGGVTVYDANYDVVSPEDSTSSFVCLCGTTIGFTVSFWEPSRMMDATKDPYCFTSIGTGLSNPKPGFLGGSGATSGSRNEIEPKSTFFQAHWAIFPVWSVLDLFIDFPCVENKGFDYAHITEVDPLWNDDLLAFVLNPEALLFANPVANLACVADSLASNVRYPLDSLFWCMGSWGSAYPLTGHINSDNYVQSSAAVTARMIYKLSRQLELWDVGLDECHPVITPIWKKSNYRMHLSKPVRDDFCYPIGKSSLLWGQLKNPPYGAGDNAGDNFNWIIFRKRLCCTGISLW